MDVPPVGRAYRLKSKATGYELCGSPATLPSDIGSVWAVDDPRPWWSDWVLEAANIGFRLRRDAWMLDSNADRDVYLQPPNDASYQMWRLIPDPDADQVKCPRCGLEWIPEGYCSLINVANGFALDGNADREVYTQLPNDGSYQRWKFIAV